ncbi:MAG: hypothetical protein AAF368_09960 [Planctomycetota bacterium]
MLDRLVNIGETIVYGVAFDPKNGERLKSMDLNELFASVGRLFDLLEEREADYVLVGGIAMLAYVEGRNTQDIDLILSRRDLARLPELVIDDDNPDFARTMLGDLRVDVLFAEHKLFSAVAKNFSTPKVFANRQVPCATEAGLLALKLFALPSLYRQGRFAKVRIYENDVAELIELMGEAPDSIYEVMAPTMMPSDLAEVRKIAEDISERLSKSKSRFSDE